MQSILDEITQHHSSYYIDHSTPPAPMLMSSGFSDDLFPADETIRYYNRTKTQYLDADLGLFYGDFGHMRAHRTRATWSLPCTDFTLPGNTSQVAARLLDVGPNGTEQLVDRGLWRPASGGPAKQVFQLHPNGWTFAPGHVPKLELLAADGVETPDLPLYISSYGRPSDGQQPVTVSNLEMRMPVVEKPGSLDGLVKAPAAKFVPQGYTLAKDFSDLDSPLDDARRQEDQGEGLEGHRKGPLSRRLRRRNDRRVKVTTRIRRKKHHHRGVGRPSPKTITVARGGFDAIGGGEKSSVKLKLTKRARHILRRNRS